MAIPMLGKVEGRSGVRRLFMAFLVSVSFASVQAEVDTGVILAHDQAGATEFRKVEEIHAGDKSVIYELEYCRIGACDLFEVRNVGDYAALADFFFLYLLYFEGEADLTKIQEHGIPPVSLILENRSNGPRVLGQYRDVCDEESELENAVCVTRHLYDEHLIAAFWVRADEGIDAKNRDNNVRSKITLQEAEETRAWLDKWKDSGK